MGGLAIPSLACPCPCSLLFGSMAKVVCPELPPSPKLVVLTELTSQHTQRASAIASDGMPIHLPDPPAVKRDAGQESVVGCIEATSGPCASWRRHQIGCWSRLFVTKPSAQQDSGFWQVRLITRLLPTKSSSNHLRAAFLNWHGRL
eukprot:6489797-Amphidinium_carterae.1